MTKGDGQSVGGIGWLGNFLHGEQGADKNLNLTFIGMAVAGNGGFYFAWRVAEDFDLMLSGGEKDNSANLGEAKSRFYIQGGKDRFHGDRVGREFANQIAKERVNGFESRACGDFALFRNAERAVVNGAARPAIRFDNAVTCGAGGGGIDAEYAHPRIC